MGCCHHNVVECLRDRVLDDFPFSLFAVHPSNVRVGRKSSLAEQTREKNTGKYREITPTKIEHLGSVPEAGDSRKSQP
jgi:hypothetical protein